MPTTTLQKYISLLITAILQLNTSVHDSENTEAVNKLNLDAINRLLESKYADGNSNDLRVTKNTNQQIKASKRSKQTKC